MPYLSDAVQELREDVRSFGEEHIKPVAGEFDETGEFPEEILSAAAERGYVGTMIPEEYGGPGMDIVSSAVVTEELWRADTNIGWAIGLTGFTTNAVILSKYGADWMQEEWLPKIAAGEAIDGIAVTEPNHGSNVAGIETSAERDGDGWVLNGEKKFIGNSPVADFLLMFAKTDLGEGHRGISAFLLPTDTDGVSVEPIDRAMGGRAAPLGRVSLDDARIPERNLVGEENRGFYYFMEALAPARITVGAQGLGGAQAAVDATVEYVTNRTQFDHEIGDFQAIRHRVAEMETKTEAARSLLYRAADSVRRDDETANRLASEAKLFATERASEVTDTAIQLHGGNGYLSEHDVERYHRDVRVTRIYEGTSEIQKNIIADDLL